MGGVCSLRTASERGRAMPICIAIRRTTRAAMIGEARFELARCVDGRQCTPNSFDADFMPTFTKVARLYRPRA